jgi:N-acetylglucosamine-6-phosphate deacetylase
VSAATTFFDLQVNGYAGVDFNQDGLQAGDLHRACERLDTDGVGGVLATIFTDDLGVMCRRLSTLAAVDER